MPYETRGCKYALLAGFVSYMGCVRCCASPAGLRRVRVRVQTPSGEFMYGVLSNARGTVTQRGNSGVNQQGERFFSGAAMIRIGTDVPSPFRRD